jgi:hypothetical protein
MTSLLAWIDRWHKPARFAVGCMQSFTHAGVTVWSSLLALTLLLLPAPALAEAKEKVSALAPSGLVLVVDGKGCKHPDQAAGAAQDLYGQTADAARETA